MVGEEGEYATGFDPGTARSMRDNLAQDGAKTAHF
jgi:hypothetical protein